MSPGRSTSPIRVLLRRVHAGRRIAGLEAAAVVDPGDGLQFGELAHQGLGAAGEFDRVDLAVRGIARHTHQLLLPLQQPQPHALLGVFDVARTDSCSRSTSSVRRYQKAETMAARNSSTAAIGASMATASCSTGVCRRHHLRHQDSG